MLLEKEAQKILNQLSTGNAVEIPFDGSDIRVRTVDDASKIYLSAPVFDGGNYIPKSVRLSVSHQAPFERLPLHTYLTVDEQHHQVQLHYLGQADGIEKEELSELIGTFKEIAAKWRDYLEEHGKNDLIYVRVK